MNNVTIRSVQGADGYYSVWEQCNCTFNNNKVKCLRGSQCKNQAESGT